MQFHPISPTKYAQKMYGIARQRDLVRAYVHFVHVRVCVLVKYAI